MCFFMDKEATNFIRVTKKGENDSQIRELLETQDNLWLAFELIYISARYSTGQYLVNSILKWTWEVGHKLHYASGSPLDVALEHLSFRPGENRN